MSHFEYIDPLGMTAMSQYVLLKSAPSRGSPHPIHGFWAPESPHLSWQTDTTPSVAVFPILRLCMRSVLRLILRQALPWLSNLILWFLLMLKLCYFRRIWIFSESIWRFSDEPWSSCHSVLSRIVCLQWMVSFIYFNNILHSFMTF